VSNKVGQPDGRTATNPHRSLYVVVASGVTKRSSASQTGASSRRIVPLAASKSLGTLIFQLTFEAVNGWMLEGSALNDSSVMASSAA